MIVRRGGVKGNFRFSNVYEIGGANKREQERRNKFEEKMFNLLLNINIWSLKKQ